MIEDPSLEFDERDRDRLAERGVTLEDAARQLALLRDGAPRFRELDRPARSGDGVTRLAPQMITDLLETAAQARRMGRVSKFVPASGAATRMFQALLTALDDYERGTIDDSGRGNVERFLESIPRLAMRYELAHRGISPDEPVPSGDRDRSRLLYRILSATEAGFAALPKGLVPFHEDEGRGRTAFEEHLLEALLYTADRDGVARVHFTVPDESRNQFEALLGELRGALETTCNGRLDVTWSSQRPSTDTIAIGVDGSLFRDESRRLVFRPGGHGALLQNLNELDGDIVVIKNIDNVVPPRRVGEIAHWKNVLIGYLATLQESAHLYLRQIHENDDEPNWLEQGLVFAEHHLSVPVPLSLRRDSVQAKREFLIKALHRPMRVCGMVRNEGEPGGGPFWVRDAGGNQSLQIVEHAEVDMSDERQAKVWNASTHFNPVDLVVGLRDWRGEQFRLDQFTNPDAVFRSRKSSGGRPLVALERPGLWNGAMAGWTTVFVEVPISTFAPVKTVFDLLRDEHR